MRLLQRNHADDFTLTADLRANDIPSYAILSHTWDDNEVIYYDVENKSNDWQQKAGYKKIKFCADQAKRHGLRHFWIDTCCINKSDAIELQTAINSMFSWYHRAERCYVFLSDVSCSSTPSQSASGASWEAAFRGSRWFMRGWTLQELIAPQIVEFYSKEGVFLGDKRSLETILRDVTGVPAPALRGTPLSSFTIAERKAWARNRVTKYEEDMAYSLLGIFGVHMPLIYGEGYDHAQKRLQEEVQRSVKGIDHDKFSISFSMSGVPETLHFVGRDNEADEMRRVLCSDGSRHVVVLHGLGGIGKTQLAATYIHRYRDEYSAIFWINVKDEASVQQNFARVATQILEQNADGSSLKGADPQQDHDKVIQAVKAWLSLPGNTRWLIVYDNYDNPKLPGRKNDAVVDIHRILPAAYQGSIIITTRLSQINIGHHIRIEKLKSKDESMQILSKTSGRHGLEHDTDAEDLIRELDGLPLALATTGAYLKRVPVSIRTYIRYYQKSWSRVTGNLQLGSYADRTLNSTWQVSYEHVRAQNPLAANLLRWWAYFNNEDIWFGLLQNSSEIGLAWMKELSEELNFNDAIGVLHDYGLVEPTFMFQECQGYSIHGCLHAWTINVLNKEWDGRLNKLAVESVASLVPSAAEAGFWQLQKRLMPHAIRFCLPIQDTDVPSFRAFNSLGNFYLDSGKLGEAEKMYLRALDGAEKALGQDDVSALSIVGNLGLLYSNQGKLDDAEEMYLRALNGKEKALGQDHTSTLQTVNNLGTLYRCQGKLGEAEEMYLRALNGKERKLGHDHKLTLQTVNNLGVLYRDQGKLDEAEKMYLRALSGYEEALGQDRTLTLYAVNNLGLLYCDQGKLEEAEKMLSRALNEYERAMELETFKTYRPAINTLMNLGLLRSKQSRLGQARQYYQRGYDGLNQLLGPSHPEVQSARETLEFTKALCEARESSSDDQSARRSARSEA